MAVAPHRRSCRRRGQSHRNSPPSTQPCSWCHEGAAEPSGGLPVPRSPLLPVAVLRPPPELRSGELRPPRVLPSPPLDAREHQLLGDGLRGPFGHRRTKSEALRRVWPRRRRVAGGFDPADQGFDLPWIADKWAQAPANFS